MTIKDLIRIYNQVDHCKVGYVCYQKDGLTTYKMIELGSNRGVYGWNWTAYLYPYTNTLYISCYRNVPACIREK